MKTLIWKNGTSSNPVEASRKDIIGLKKASEVAETSELSGVIKTSDYIYKDEIPYGITVLAKRQLTDLTVSDKGVLENLKTKGLIKGRYSKEEALELLTSEDYFSENDNILSIEDIDNFTGLTTLDLHGNRNLSGDLDLSDKDYTKIDVSGTNVRNLILKEGAYIDIHEACPTKINIINQPLLFTTFLPKYITNTRYVYNQEGVNNVMGIPCSKIVEQVPIGITSAHYSIDDVRLLETINITEPKGGNIMSMFTAIKEVDKNNYLNPKVEGSLLISGYALQSAYDIETGLYQTVVNFDNYTSKTVNIATDSDVITAITELATVSGFSNTLKQATISELIRHINPSIGTIYKQSVDMCTIKFDGLSVTSFDKKDISNYDESDGEMAYGSLDRTDIITKDANILAIFFRVLGMPLNICLSEALKVVNNVFITNTPDENGTLTTVDESEMNLYSRIWYNDGTTIKSWISFVLNGLYFKMGNNPQIYSLISISPKKNICKSGIVLGSLGNFGSLGSLGSLGDLVNIGSLVNICSLDNINFSNNVILNLYTSLQSDTNTYFDTGIQLTPNMGFRVFVNNSSSRNSDTFAFGTYRLATRINMHDGRYYNAYAGQGFTFIANYGYGSWETISINYKQSLLMQAEYSLYLSNITLFRQGSDQIFIFAMNEGGGAAVRFFKGKLGPFVITEGEDITHLYWPCRCNNIDGYLDFKTGLFLPPAAGIVVGSVDTDIHITL